MEGYRIISKEQFLNQILRCSEEELTNHIHNKDNAYNKYIKKKKSGRRTIYAIIRTNPLYFLQNNLQSSFFRNYLFPESVCGFRKGKSYYDFLTPHISRAKTRFFLRLDISDFFGSIRIEDLRDALSYYFVNDITDEEKKWVISAIIEIVTVDNMLVQGALTSPILSNLVFRSLDIRIEKYCHEFGIIYTRYADDMLFSSSTSYVHNYKFQNMIKAIIKDKGFKLNINKTIRSSNKISINGYVIDNGIRLSRKKYKDLNKIIFDMKKKSFVGFSDKREEYRVKNKLAGYRAFLIDSSRTISDVKYNKRVESKIEQIEHLIRKYCKE